MKWLEKYIEIDLSESRNRDVDDDFLLVNHLILIAGADTGGGLGGYSPPL